MRLRSRTGFSVQTSLSQEALVAGLREVADRFKVAHSFVSDIRVEPVGASEVDVSIVMATPNYATADQVADALVADLHTQIQQEQWPIDIEARETELIPA